MNEIVLLPLVGSEESASTTKSTTWDGRACMIKGYYRCELTKMMRWCVALFDLWVGLAMSTKEANDMTRHAHAAGLVNSCWFVSFAHLPPAGLAILCSCLLNTSYENRTQKSTRFSIYACLHDVHQRRTKGNSVTTCKTIIKHRFPSASSYCEGC